MKIDVPREAIPATAHASYDRLRSAYKRLVHLWASLQIQYHGGKNSIERALALDAYTQTTALSRVLLVCIGTPLPMVALIFLQELLPLQNPAAGWDHNYGFWIRQILLSSVTTITFLVQPTFMVDGFTLSRCQLAMFGIGITGIQTAASMAVSATLAFPIPFFYVTMTPSFFIPLFTLLYVLMGPDSAKTISFITTQKLMGIIYPIYQLLFHKTAETHYILPVVLLQPVIKLVIKNIVLKITKDLEDMTPETVIFTVDFYNAVYLATFMESASTFTTMLILIGTDITQTAMVLYKMHQRTSSILPRLRQFTNAVGDEDLLTALCLLCRNEHQFESQMNNTVRIRSCLEHNLKPEDTDFLSLLEKAADQQHLGLQGSRRWSSSSSNGSVFRKASLSYSSFLIKLRPKFRARRVQPIRPLPAFAKTTTLKEGPSVILINQHPGVLQETLAVLYTMECLALTAYVEALIPLFYGNYMLIMVHLPNAKYHTELGHVTTQNVEYTARGVFLFGLLQAASFALLAALIQRNCNMNILYHVAFVLETQMPLVQGKLMIWMIVTLACRVVHFGVDYSFKFAWI